ncbi:MAG: hypothetical protein ACTHMS_11005 [Jatrophihabitans sp.]|uniref:hypothetical protein n=1 Tax=Jatrophihabitans sp. TaxID=1932789 RepID=UPI003F80CF54
MTTSTLTTRPLVVGWTVVVLAAATVTLSTGGGVSAWAGAVLAAAALSVPGRLGARRLFPDPDDVLPRLGATVALALLVALFVGVVLVALPVTLSRPVVVWTTVVAGAVASLAAGGGAGPARPSRSLRVTPARLAAIAACGALVAATVGVTVVSQRHAPAAREATAMWAVPVSRTASGEVVRVTVESHEQGRAAFVLRLLDGSQVRDLPLVLAAGQQRGVEVTVPAGHDVVCRLVRSDRPRTPVVRQLRWNA